MRWGILAVLLLVAVPARAEDWRYCLAQNEAGRSVYVTRPFQTDRDIDTLEHAFNHRLDGDELPHTWGICPRSISPFGPERDVAHALDYNRGLGLRAILIEWMP